MHQEGECRGKEGGEAKAEKNATDGERPCGGAIGENRDQEHGAEKAGALDGGFADAAEDEGSEGSASGERCPEDDDGGLAAEDFAGGVADAVGGKPLREAGFQAAVEKEHEAKGEEDVAGEGMRCNFFGGRCDEAVTGVDRAREGDDDERRGEGEKELAEGVVGQKSGDEDAGENGSKAPEEIDDGKRGAGVGGVAATREDVGRSDDLAETDSCDEEGKGAAV